MKPIERYSSFYFVGVAGAGMSAIAQYLAGKGFKVSGSDRQFSAKNSKERELPVHVSNACGTDTVSRIHFIYIHPHQRCII